MVDIAKLFGIAMKGLSVVRTLAQQGKDVQVAVQSLENVFSKEPGQVTDDELDDLESDLDSRLDDFETPLTRKT